MRWMVAILVLSLAGCVTPQVSTPLSPTRGDAATATYSGPLGDYVLSANRSAVWTPLAENVEGTLVLVNGGVPKQALLMSEGGVAAFALDDCQRPLWSWRGPLVPTSDQPAFVAFANDPSAVNSLQTLWSVRRDDLPASGTAILERGVLDLHVRAFDDGWGLQWTRRGEPANETRLAQDPEARLRWPTESLFPQSFRDFTLVSSSNGGLVHDCIREAPIAPQAWGRWGPQQDPPVGHSYNDMVAQVLDDPLLLEFQAAREAKPDGYFFDVQVLTSLSLNPSVPGDADWLMAFGSPGDVVGIGVHCRVNVLGSEAGLAVFSCDDRFSWDHRDVPVGTPPDFPFVTPDNSRFFDMARRWDEATFHPLSFHFWEGNDADLWTSYTVTSVTAAGAVQVEWDPVEGHLTSLRGLDFESFLHPPH